MTLMVLIAGLPSLHADTLDTHTVSITGSIIQETNTTTAATAIMPITIKNVLNVLGVTGDPDTFRYYLDYTTRSIVIAPKSDAAAGSGSPTATVFTFGDSSVAWEPTDHSSIDAADATGLNGNLSGTSLEDTVYPHTVRTGRIKFVLYGTNSGLPTIMKGSIVVVFMPFG